MNALLRLLENFRPKYIKSCFDANECKLMFENNSKYIYVNNEREV